MVQHREDADQRNGREALGADLLDTAPDLRGVQLGNLPAVDLEAAVQVPCAAILSDS
jgi:hypothetical protein